MNSSTQRSRPDFSFYHCLIGVGFQKTLHFGCLTFLRFCHQHGPTSYTRQHHTAVTVQSASAFSVDVLKDAEKVQFPEVRRFLISLSFLYFDSAFEAFIGASLACPSIARCQDCKHIDAFFLFQTRLSTRLPRQVVTTETIHKFPTSSDDPQSGKGVSQPINSIL